MGLGHNINDGRRTQDIKISQDVTFETMLLKPKTLKGLKDAGFYQPSPIQLHGIPLGKCGFDLLLEAKSGTGKTAVFTVIALEKLDLQKGLQVIILAPTREIAMQIHDVVKEIGSKYQGLRVEVVMGGLPLQDDIEKFKKPVHIVVGSPGRLRHLIQDKFINTSAIRMLVMDEADKLMEKSYQSDIKYIHSSLPQQKQIIMSSATYPESSKTFIQSYVQNAQHICPDSNNVLLGIEQKVTVVQYNVVVVKQTHNKFLELTKILSYRQFKQGLIFCNYQARVSEIHKMLSKERWPAEQLYGLQEQTHRLDALKTLQEYKCRLLISTDLAARGIDASNVDLVINFEPPYEWQTYLHRIGRAGRFGSYGTAITILSEGVEENKFKNLLESIKHPFDLTYLWSNEKFSLKCVENVSEDVTATEYVNPTICHQNEYIHDSAITLWTALINDIKLKKPLENFDSLCRAFIEQDVDSEIEVFNDLLQSFKSNQDIISEDNEFVKMELLELPINEINIDSPNLYKNINNNGVKLLENNETISKCELDDAREKERQAENSEITIVDQEIVSEFSESKQDTEKIVIAVDSEQNGSSGKDNDNFVDNSVLLRLDRNENDKIDKTDFSTEHETMNTALADLGLPTSFSSSKRAYNIQNKISTDNNNLQYSRSTNNEVNIKKPKKRKKKVKIDIESYHAKESFRKNKNSSLNNMEVPGLSKIQSSKNKPKHTTYTYNDQNVVYHKEHSKESYINWYNALKLRMKRIEYFLYINEINKL